MVDLGSPSNIPVLWRLSMEWSIHDRYWRQGKKTNKCGSLINIYMYWFLLRLRPDGAIQVYDNNYKSDFRFFKIYGKVQHWTVVSFLFTKSLKHTLGAHLGKTDQKCQTLWTQLYIVRTKIGILSLCFGPNCDTFKFLLPKCE